MFRRAHGRVWTHLNGRFFAINAEPRPSYRTVAPHDFRYRDPKSEEGGRDDFISARIKCIVAAIGFIYVFRYLPCDDTFHCTGSHTRPCRKYVDLVNISSAKYVYWDPPRRVEVGYGDVSVSLTHILHTRWEILVKLIHNLFARVTSIDMKLWFLLQRTILRKFMTQSTDSKLIQALLHS